MIITSITTLEISKNKKIMKKLFIAAAVLSTLAFASCGNKTTSQAGAADSTADTTAVVDSALSAETQASVSTLTGKLAEVVKTGDTKQLTTTLADLAATYKALVNAGKLQEALSYGQTIKAFVNEHADQIKSVAGNNATINKLLTAVQNLPTDASTTAEAAKAAVKSEAVGLASSYLQKAAATSATAAAAAEALKALPTQATDAAKSAVTEAKDAAKAKVDEKVTETKEKAAETVNKTVDDAKQKALKGLGL